MHQKLLKFFYSIPPLIFLKSLRHYALQTLCLDNFDSQLPPGLSSSVGFRESSPTSHDQFLFQAERNDSIGLTTCCHTAWTKLGLPRSGVAA